LAEDNDPSSSSALTEYDLLLYPNPGREVAVLYCSAGLKSIEVTDVLGRSLLVGALNGSVQHTIATSAWEPGDYVFRVEREDGMVEHRKFVKQ